MLPTGRRRALPIEAAFTVGAVAAVLVGAGLRLYTTSDLWLDEALSVNIARLPVGDLLDQLRRDGHPPLYYLLLHGWIDVFGEGDVAVRSLSALFGVGLLPLMWLAARRYGGRACAVAATLLLATSPFAIRYATEARMYALLMFLVLAGWLLVREALERPRLAALVGVAVVSGLLALTHYWSFYLLAASVLVLGWRWRRGSASALRVGLAVMAGSVVFLPWLPTFLDQLGSTGTPWGRRERPTNVLAISFTDWGGGPNGEAQLLGVGLLLLVLLALFGRALDGLRVELDLRTRSQALGEATVVFGTIGLAVLAGYAADSAFASRYTAIVFPLVILLAGLGSLSLGDVRFRAAVLAVLGVVGIIGGARNFDSERTQGGQMARYITAQGAPGDVVAFCPDQLGPSVVRHFPDGFVGVPFPGGDDPRFVDWVDYEERMAAADPEAFAAALHDRAGQRTVWLVWAPGYRTLGRKCERAVDALKVHRPGGRAVVSSGGAFEHMWLYQYGPVPE